jgi:hypothetical protein
VLVLHLVLLRGGRAVQALARRGGRVQKSWLVLIASRLMWPSGCIASAVQNHNSSSIRA